jgi:hypothetical protein
MLDFQEAMRMFNGGFTFFAIVEIIADRAFISDSDNRVDATSIASNRAVHNVRWFFNTTVNF